MVNSTINEFITVNVTDNAVSNLIIQHIKFEIVPPGQILTINIPALISGSKLEKDVNNNAISGNNIICKPSPKKIDLGFLRLYKKLLIVSDEPIPNIMSPITADNK